MCVRFKIKPSLTSSIKILFLSRLNGRQHTWRLKSTSAKERALQYHPGEKIHGFTVKEVGSLGTPQHSDSGAILVFYLNLREELWSAVWNVGLCCLISRL